MGGKSSKQKQVNESFGFNQNIVSRMGNYNKLKKASNTYIRNLKNRTTHYNDHTLSTERLKNTNNYKTFHEYAKKIPGVQMENYYNGKKTERKYYVNSQSGENGYANAWTNDFSRWRRTLHRNPKYLSKQNLINKLKNKYKNINGLDRNVLFYMYKNPNSNASSFLRR
jgi:hypothetical protein